MDTEGAASITLDQALTSMKVKKVDFIKLDVDGHEPTVLAGAKKTLHQHRPPILMEFAPYLYEQTFHQFEEMVRSFARLRYSLKDADSGVELPLEAQRLRELIPSGGTRNVLLQRS
jgi:hypothetical protein